MKRITITGVVDLDGDDVTKETVETWLDDMRAYGTAEVTAVEEIVRTPDLPQLERARDWHGY